jgi:hypothetical protein
MFLGGRWVRVNHDIGGCHRRHGFDSRFEFEFVHDLDGHQGDDPVRSGLDFYLGHDVISDDAYDQARELIAGGYVQACCRFGTCQPE